MMKTDNPECICGRLEGNHDVSGWCIDPDCVCSYFDPVEDDWATAGMHVITEVDG